VSVAEETSGVLEQTVCPFLEGFKAGRMRSEISMERYLNDLQPYRGGR
jgi:hypothetical protein